MSNEKNLNISIRGQQEFCKAVEESCTSLNALVSGVNAANTQMASLDDSFFDFSEFSQSFLDIAEAGNSVVQVISSICGSESSLAANLSVVTDALETQATVIQTVTTVQKALNSSMLANITENRNLRRSL